MHIAKKTTDYADATEQPGEQDPPEDEEDVDSTDDTDGPGNLVYDTLFLNRFSGRILIYLFTADNISTFYNLVYSSNFSCIYLHFSLGIYLLQHSLTIIANFTFNCSTLIFVRF